MIGVWAFKKKKNLYTASFKCSLATKKLYFMKPKILQKTWFSPPWTEKKNDVEKYYAAAEGVL